MIRQIGISNLANEVFDSSYIKPSVRQLKNKRHNQIFIDRSGDDLVYNKSKKPDIWEKTTDIKNRKYVENVYRLNGWN
jgi:ABC-type Fe3+-hydroxamate transport system substrate-binding protein